MNLSWEDVFEKIQIVRKVLEGQCKSDQTLKLWAIPRGGSMVLGLLLHDDFDRYFEGVDNPEEADFAIDDIIDSGRTRESLLENYRLFTFALVDKQPEGIMEWVTFPWEVGESPLTLLREEPIITEDKKFAVSYEMKICPYIIAGESHEVPTLIIQRKDLTTHHICNFCHRSYCFAGETVSLMDFHESIPRKKQITVSQARLDALVKMYAKKKKINEEQALIEITEMASADSVHRDIEARTL